MSLYFSNKNYSKDDQDLLSVSGAHGCDMSNYGAKEVPTKNADNSAEASSVDCMPVFRFAMGVDPALGSLADYKKPSK